MYSEIKPVEMTTLEHIIRMRGDMQSVPEDLKGKGREREPLIISFTTNFRPLLAHLR